MPFPRLNTLAFISSLLVITPLMASKRTIRDTDDANYTGRNVTRRTHEVVPRGIRRPHRFHLNPITLPSRKTLATNRPYQRPKFSVPTASDYNGHPISDLPLLCLEIIASHLDNVSLSYLSSTSATMMNRMHTSRVEAIQEKSLLGLTLTERERVMKRQNVLKHILLITEGCMKGDERLLYLMSSREFRHIQTITEELVKFRSGRANVAKDKQILLEERFCSFLILNSTLIGDLFKPNVPRDFIDHESLILKNYGATGIRQGALVDVTPNLSKAILTLNRFQSVHFLEPFDKLVEVNLCGNPLNDLTSLGRLTSLVTLDIGNPIVDCRSGNLANLVQDLSPLTSLQNLASLYVRSPGIRNYMPLGSLTNLQSLRIGYSSVSDTSFLKALQTLRTLELETIGPISDLGSIQVLTTLRELVLFRVGGNGAYLESTERHKSVLLGLGFDTLVRHMLRIPQDFREELIYHLPLANNPG